MVRAVLVCLLAVVTLPSFTVAPRTGIDPSWQAGLQLAARDGMHWGSEVAFTYGPLGFVDTTRLFVPHLALTAVLLALVTHVVVVAWAVDGALRRLPWWVAVPVVHLALSIGVARQLGKAQTSGVLVAVVAAGLLRLLWRPDVPSAQPGSPEAAPVGARVPVELLLAAVVVGVLGLVKVNDAAVGAAVLAVATVGIGLRDGVDRSARWRAARLLGVVGATAGGTFVTAWVLAGQRLADLPAYVAASVEIAAGFAPAMVRPLSPGEGPVLASVLLLAVAALAWVVHEARLAGGGPGRVVASAAVLLLLLAGAFKQGLVRHDGYELFAAAVVVGLLAWRRATALGLALVAVAVGGVLVVQGAVPWRTVDLVARAATAESTVRLFASGAERHQIVEQARERMLAEYRLDPSTLDRLRGATVLADPSEVAMVWAVRGTAWAPAPVFQSYQAYTAALDDANAATLEGPGAPELVVREKRQYDDQAPRWVSPRFVLTLLCEYRHVVTDDRYRLFEDVPDRCAAPRALGEVGPVPAGRPVEVPTAGADELVVARFDTAGGGLVEALRAVAYAPVPPEVSAGRAGAFRFVRGHEGNPHVLVLPDCLGEHVPDPVAYGPLIFDVPVAVSFEAIPITC